jgi:regulator of nucleoside diphosphate kinase
MSRPDGIIVTNHDYARLRRLVDLRRGREEVEVLDSELERASLVSVREVPDDVVTMNSSVELEDVDTGERKVTSIVFPGAAAPANGRVSVLAPLGTALLGSRVGSAIEWPMPGGAQRYVVKRVCYQPEAAGRFDL